MHTRDVLRARLGDDAFGRVLASLPPADRRRYDELDAMDWLPLRITEAVIVASAGALRMEPELFLHDVVLEASRVAIHRLYKIAVRLASDALLVDRAPFLYEKIRNVGVLRAQLVPSADASLREAQAVLEEWPGLSRFQALAIAASLEAWLVVAGKQRVQITTSLRSGGATFRLAWSAR